MPDVRNLPSTGSEHVGTATEVHAIFINGSQKRVPRPPLIDGLSVEEFIDRNADPIW